MFNRIGSLIRDLGLGFFVNGLFRITQNGYTYKTVSITLISAVLIVMGIILQGKGK